MRICIEPCFRAICVQDLDYCFALFGVDFLSFPLDSFQGYNYVEEAVFVLHVIELNSVEVAATVAATVAC